MISLRFLRPAVGLRSAFCGPKPFSTCAVRLNETQNSSNSTLSSLLTKETPSQQSQQPKRQTKKIVNNKVLKHVLHCNFKKNNTFLTLTKVEYDMNHEASNPQLTYNDKVLYYITLPEKVMLSHSTGAVGFRKAQRGEYEASYQLTTHVFKSIRERNLFDAGGNLELVVKEFGKGRKAFFDALKGKEGTGIREHVSKLTDLTPIKFGGVRSPARRRI